MYLVAGDIGAYLDAGDDREAREAGGGLQGWFYPLHRVVVGDGDDLQPQSGGAPDQLLRAQQPVGGGG